jgi:hypothetical protein
MDRGAFVHKRGLMDPKLYVSSYVQVWRTAWVPSPIGSAPRTPTGTDTGTGPSLSGQFKITLHKKHVLLAIVVVAGHRHSGF